MRLIPLLSLSYVVAYIDRVNIAFAKLTMSKDLPTFDTEVIAMGAGLFFIGYFLLEIPGSLIVERLERAPLDRPHHDLVGRLRRHRQLRHRVLPVELLGELVQPPLFALAAQMFVGFSSDRTRERRFHTAIPIALGALALLLTPLSLGALPLTMALLIVARTGIKSYRPAFWTLPSAFLSSTAAAGALGFINSVGNLGGFVGPNVLGQVHKATGSFEIGIWFLGGLMLFSSLIVLYLFRTGRPQIAATSPSATSAAPLTTSALTR